jgi:phosphate-selective porin OprO/OprP
VKPIPVFNPREGKWGAWELQLRYSRLDMLDGDFHGGGPPFTQGAGVHDVTLGINWFLNAQVKMGADFVHSTRADLHDAHYDVIEARLAWCL